MRTVYGLKKRIHAKERWTVLVGFTQLNSCGVFTILSSGSFPLLHRRNWQDVAYAVCDSRGSECNTLRTETSTKAEMCVRVCVVCVRTRLKRKERVVYCTVYFCALASLEDFRQSPALAWLWLGAAGWSRGRRCTADMEKDVSAQCTKDNPHWTCRLRLT